MSAQNKGIFNFLPCRIFACSLSILVIFFTTPAISQSSPRNTSDAPVFATDPCGFRRINPWHVYYPENSTEIPDSFILTGRWDRIIESARSSEGPILIEGSMDIAESQVNGLQSIASARVEYARNLLIRNGIPPQSIWTRVLPPSNSSNQSDTFLLRKVEISVVFAVSECMSGLRHVFLEWIQENCLDFTQIGKQPQCRLAFERLRQMS